MYKALTRDIVTAMDLPTHQTLIDPRTGSPLAAVGLRRDGSPIWPVMGGDGTGDGGDGGDGGTGGDPPKTFTQAELDKIVSERLARQKSQFGDYEDLKAKAKAHDELIAANASDHEKALAQARTEADAKARTEERQRYGGQLVDASIRAAVAGRLDAEKLGALLEPIDRSRFMTADGGVDEEKVKAYVAGIVPVKPETRAPNLQQGARGNAGAGGQSASVASGRDLWKERHPTKTNS